MFEYKQSIYWTFSRIYFVLDKCIQMAVDSPIEKICAYFICET